LTTEKLLNVGVSICYLDCHEAGRCCYLVKVRVKLSLCLTN
jgi:hypothetical protein